MHSSEDTRGKLDSRPCGKLIEMTNEVGGCEFDMNPWELGSVRR